MIGVLSDGHGNSPAFARMTEILFALGADRLIYLGDAMGYVPSLEVVEQLRRLGGRVECVLGNHEHMLLGAEYPAELESIYRVADLRSQLTREHEAFLRTWPDARSKEFACGRALFVHGSPRDHLHGQVHPDTPLENFAVPYDFVFLAHTHRAFVRPSASTTFVNVGSCGLPRDDGRYASAALFDPVAGSVRIIRLGLARLPVASLLSRYNVHSSVRGLFSRRQAIVAGEIIES